MAVSENFRDFVLDQLAELDQVHTRKMFGAIGVYCGLHFFGIISEDTLYFKVDDSNRPDYEAAGMEPFRPYADQSLTMQYYEVPAEVLEDRGSLAAWARRSVDAARRKIAARKSSRRR